MAANSKNAYDVYIWIEKVINSCDKSYTHYKIASRLIENFAKLYPDFDRNLIFSLQLNLRYIVNYRL
jgi:hypothetical protein